MSDLNLSNFNRRYARFFGVAESRAMHYVKSPWRAARLVYRASVKSEGPGSAASAAFSRAGAREQWQRFKALLRMLRAWSAGTYTELPARTLVLGIAALIYFVSPIDAIADFIPVVGLIDDVTIVALVLKAIQHDLDKFRSWEDSEHQIIEGERPSTVLS